MTGFSFPANKTVTTGSSQFEIGLQFQIWRRESC